MDLQLPQRKQPGSLSFNTEPATLSAWLEDLPLINTGKSRELLDDALQQINTLRLPPDNRRETLERFTTPVICITDALKKEFLNKSLPLKDNNLVAATQTVELCNNMATGYRILADDLRNNDNDKPQLAIALHRAMRYLGEILLTSYRIYIQYPEGLWKTIHALYALADEYRITGHEVTDITLQTPAPSSIETAYKQVLLLSLACPYRLRQKDIHFVYSTLLDWADSSELHHMDDENIHGLFSINLQSDDPPSYRNLTDTSASDAHIRILDTNRMAARIRKHLDADQDSSGQQKRPEITETLQRLMLAWGVMPKRRFARHPQDAQIQLVIGLDAINRIALGPDTNEQAADGEIQDRHYLRDPTFDNVTIISMDTFTGKHSRQAPAGGSNPFKGAYSADKPPASRIESWGIADISAGGYCLLSDSDQASCAQVGELVALIEDGHAEHDKWQLGTIRRMKFTDKHGLELGIQLLSPGARTIWAQPYDNGASKGDRIQGILLPGIAAIKQQASLLLPSLPFRTGYTARLEDGGKTETVKLTQQLENTGSFAQYHFSPQ